MSNPQQPADAAGSGKQSGKGKSKQMFLDLGQRDFNASKCRLCGMMYAKGHEEDEKLHKVFHQTAVQGLKFQGWAQERVLLSEPFSGRLLMVLPTDPAAHVKRVQEVCGFVERAHGLIPGWLMAAPNCKVFLYVSLQRRVTAVAVLEPLKQAYRVAAAAATAADEEAESLPATQQQQQLLCQLPPDNRQLASPPAAAAHNAAGVGGSSSGALTSPVSQQQQQQQFKMPQQQQQQQRPLLWAGLHRRAAGADAAAGASSATSGGSGSGRPLLSPGVSSAGGGFSVKADSCPSSFLAAAQQVQIGVASSAAGVDCVEGVGKGCVALQQQQQGESQQQDPQQVVASTAAAAEVEASQGLLSQQSAGAAAAASGRGGRSGGTAGRSRSKSSQGVAAGAAGGSSQGGAASARDAAAAAAAAGPACLLVDKRKALRAMLGVRMLWVSAEQRRKGLATKLLDVARCNMVMGYVVPRNQLAFTQPTYEGAKLAAAFTGTQQFLVYGLD